MPGLLENCDCNRGWGDDYIDGDDWFCSEDNEFNRDN